MPRNNLHNSNFVAFGGGGPWLGLHGPSNHYVGPTLVLKYPHCYQMITQIHPRGTKVSEQIKLSENFSGVTQRPINHKNGQFLTDKGPIGGGQRGYLEFLGGSIRT